MTDCAPKSPESRKSANATHPPLWRPPILIATWFGSGWLPVMPGTWGSLAALPFAWWIHATLGPNGLMAAAVVAFFVGIRAADIYARETGQSDPGAVVIDEVAGQWLTLALAAPLDPLYYVIGFVLFRIADIFKPWPVNWADRNIKGGLGIMVDDIFAALYAALALVAIGYLSGAY